jgi:type III pantothenate kinase
MSVRLVTTPWLTKNLAGGGLDTRRLLGGLKGTGRADGTADDDRRRPRIRGSPAYHPGMLLALDIGNTNVTAGLFRAGALLATRRAPTHARATADTFELLLDGLLRLDGIGLADLDAMALASVVPALTGAVESIAARHDIALLSAGAGTVPLAVRVDHPARRAAGWSCACGRPTPRDAGRRRRPRPRPRSTGHPTERMSVAASPRVSPSTRAAADRQVPRADCVPDRAIGRVTISAIQSGRAAVPVARDRLLAHIRREPPRRTESPTRTPGDPDRRTVGRPWAAVIPDATHDPGRNFALAILDAEVGGGEPLGGADVLNATSTAALSGLA